MPLSKNTQYSRIADAVAGANTTVEDCFVAEHYTAGTPGVGYGAGTLYRGATTASGAAQDMVRIGSRWTNVGAGTEASTFFVQTRFIGLPLADKFTVSALSTSTGTSVGVFTPAASGSSSISLAVTAQAAVTLIANGSNIGGTTFGVTSARGAFLVGNNELTGGMGIGSIIANALTFGTNATGRWQIGATSGHLLAFLDNTYDIGAVGATRPRSIYVGTNVTAGGTVSAGNAAMTSAANDSYFYGGNNAGAVTMAGDGTLAAYIRITGPSHTSPSELTIGAATNKIGFYATAPVAQQTGVAVTAAAIHAALVNLGLITA